MTTDQARCYLKEQYSRTFHKYIDTKLAGDFAVAVATKQQLDKRMLATELKSLELVLGLSNV